MASEKGGDIEAISGGAAAAAAPAAPAAVLYPKMSESPELRWAFIRKVYAIVLIQLFITAATAATIALVRPIPHFFTSNTPAAWAVYILIIFFPLIFLAPLLYFQHRHPINLLLLGLYSICMGMSLGAVAAFNGREIILEAAVLTIVVVVGLTLYTFWAAKRGHDFSFMGLFLFIALLALIVYCAIQILHPLGRVSRTIYGCLSAIVFCGFIVFDTDNLIKRHTYNEYVIAAISLYLDAINLFTSLVAVGSS